MAQSLCHMVMHHNHYSQHKFMKIRAPDSALAPAYLHSATECLCNQQLFFDRAVGSFPRARTAPHNHQANPARRALIAPFVSGESHPKNKPGGAVMAPPGLTVLLALPYSAGALS